MRTNRLEAFSDGVIAIIITIMVLELKPPRDPDIHSLVRMWPTFSAYVLSFIIIAIYWVNHHHLIHLVSRVDAAILWANMNLLFWLSVVHGPRFTWAKIIFTPSLSRFTPPSRPSAPSPSFSCAFPLRVISMSPTSKN